MAGDIGHRGGLGPRRGISVVGRLVGGDSLLVRVLRRGQQGALRGMDPGVRAGGILIFHLTSQVIPLGPGHCTARAIGVFACPVGGWLVVGVFVFDAQGLVSTDLIIMSR